MTLAAFKENTCMSIGVELELQLIDLQDYNLAMEAKDFLRRLEERVLLGEIKPEITQSMIEINSSVHTNYVSLIQELRATRDVIAEEARKTHIGICGGGAHPFQKWKQQRIFPTERFSNLSDQYGFLAKQFTVFGQHIHIGCANGDDALYLCHALARYIPQFIALSAASPFNQGVNTSFDCSRLTVISAFPLSGTPPWLLDWKAFEVYYTNMYELGIIKSMKDFYWDVRPKPEFGTVEIRICDTPLTVERAADIAAYAQILAAWLLDRRAELCRDVYLTYLMNRFNAARYGLEAVFVDVERRVHVSLIDDILLCCEQLQPYAEKFNCQQALQNIKSSVLQKENGASWIRQCHSNSQSLPDTVRSQVKLWAR